MKKKINIIEKNITITDAMKQLIDESENANLTHETIKFYQDGCNFFNQFLNCKKEKYKIYMDNDEYVCGDSPITYLCLPLIDKYKSFMLNEKNIASETVNTRLRTVRRLVNFCSEKGYIALFKVKMIKSSSPVPELYSQEQQELMIKMPTNFTFAILRNWALVNFFLGTGARSKTVRYFKKGNVNLSNDMLVFNTVKSRKPYMIPLTPALKNVFVTYLKYFPGGDDDYLFCNQFGGLLSHGGLRSGIESYLKRLNIYDKGLHKFRHTFAYECAKNKGDIKEISLALGHSSVAVTEQYLKQFNLTVTDRFSSYNPLEKIKGNRTAIKIK